MRLIGLVLAASLALPPHVADRQSIGKIPRLCFLTFDPGTPQSPSPRFEAFFEGLRDLGYVHGKTITIDYLVAEGRSEKFPELAAECVRLKANIIVVSTTPAAHAAKNTTRTIRIVMVALGDPVFALAHERDGHWVGAHAVARDAAGRVGGVEEGRNKLK